MVKRSSEPRTKFPTQTPAAISNMLPPTCTLTFAYIVVDDNCVILWPIMSPIINTNVLYNIRPSVSISVCLDADIHAIDRQAMIHQDIRNRNTLTLARIVGNFHLDIGPYLSGQKRCHLVSDNVSYDQRECPF